MTQHLETLKGILQKPLNDEHFEGYESALSDALYATNLGVTALEGWMKPWLTDEIEAYTFEDDYQQGVQFVAEQWDRVLSEGGEGEGL